MRVLLGSHNPAKKDYYRAILEGTDIEIVSLEDLQILSEPEENGDTPLANAIAKARFYGAFSPKVLCADSGLYLLPLKANDPRQPGVKPRRPQGIRLTDEEMIAYYSKLIHSLGGKVSAYYQDGIAISNQGNISTFTTQFGPDKPFPFALIDTPSKDRKAGFPLDSLSINLITGRYFTEKPTDEEDKASWAHQKESLEGLRKFILDSFHGKENK